MYEFFMIFGAILIVFVIMIFWFMGHEETKAYNYSSRQLKRYQGQFSEIEKKCHDLVEANNQLGDKVTELKGDIEVIKTAKDVNSINHSDHLDNIAEVLGKKVTYASWIDKTVTGKTAVILKKIEKLKNNKGYL